MKRFVKIIWLALTVVMVVFLAAPLVPGKDERLIVFVYLIGALTFPICLVVFGLAAIGLWLLPLLPFAIMPSRSLFVALGSIFILAGYLQWFVWLPRLWGAWQEWRQPPEPFLLVDDSGFEEGDGNRSRSR